MSNEETGAVDCPPGYLPLFRSSPFLDATGPYFYRQLEQGFTIGLRIARKYTNARDTLHGGLVATRADVSLGYVTAASQDPPLRMLTTSLNIDYIGAARVGEWVESRVEIIKTGARLTFAQAIISAEGRPVARASEVFMVTGNTPT